MTDNGIRKEAVESGVQDMKAPEARETEEKDSSAGSKVKTRPVLTVMLALSVLIVSAVSLADGTYSEYRREHEDVPDAVICIDALSEGIFPWTQLTAYASVDPGYVSSGPGAVQEETGSEAETQQETIAVPDVRPEETKAAETAKEAAGTKPAETKPAETKPVSASGPDTAGAAEQGTAGTFTRVDMSYFSDAAFVGDSFTQGLMLYADIPGADCLCYQSKNTRNIMDSEIHLKNGSRSTVRSELSKKQYGKIYIMLGINELSNDAAGFAARYQKVINEIRALQPGAVIFIQSIFHTTPNKSANSNFKNNLVDLNNQALAGLADNKTVFYVDVNPPFDDGTGALRADYSGDGVHLKASRYKEWRDYLLNFGVK